MGVCDMVGVMSFISLWILAILIGIGLSVKSPSMCDYCTSSDCESGKCGYLQVHSKAGFVSQFCVSGSLNDDVFCCNSGTFDSGKTRQLYLPCGSKEILLRAENEVLINSWSAVALRTYNDSDVKDCFEISGTTTIPKWEQESCQ